MDKYIKDLLGISQINNLKKRQLLLQQNVDELLEKHIKYCSSEVAIFLISTRKFFRNIQSENSCLSIYKIKDNIIEELNISINFYEKCLNKLNEPNFSCKEFKNLVF